MSVHVEKYQHISLQQAEWFEVFFMPVTQINFFVCFPESLSLSMI